MELIVKRTFFYQMADGSAREGWDSLTAFQPAKNHHHSMLCWKVVGSRLSFACFVDRGWCQALSVLMSLDGSTANECSFSIHIITSNTPVLYLRNNNSKTFLLLHQDIFLMEYILDNDNFISKEKHMPCKGSGFDVVSSVAGFGLFISSLKEEE